MKLDSRQINTSLYFGLLSSPAQHNSDGFNRESGVTLLAVLSGRGALITTVARQNHRSFGSAGISNMYFYCKCSRLLGVQVSAVCYIG